MASKIENSGVLLSVKSVYAELLISGCKTVELRRKFPQDLPKGTEIYIYASGSLKKIIGKCEIQKIEKLKIKELWKKCADSAMISWDDFENYFNDCEFGFAIYVSKPLRFENTLRLTEFKSNLTDNRPPQSYCYI